MKGLSEEDARHVWNLHHHRRMHVIVYKIKNKHVYIYIYISTSTRTQLSHFNRSGIKKMWFLCFYTFTDRFAYICRDDIFASPLYVTFFVPLPVRNTSRTAYINRTQPTMVRTANTIICIRLYLCFTNRRRTR